MNLIEQLIASGMFPQPGAALPGVLTNPPWSTGYPSPLQNEAGAAQEARDAAAKRLAAGVRRPAEPAAAPAPRPPSVFDTGPQIGMLAANAPFSAGAGLPDAPRPALPPDDPHAPVPEEYPAGGDPVVDGVPMPRARPAGADTMPTDISSANREAPGDPTNIVPSPQQLTQSSAAPPAANPTSIFDKLMSGLGDRSSQLIAMGAGFAGAPNIGQGLSRAGAAVLPAREADFKRSQLLGAQQSKLNALLKAGVPNEQAIAAMYDPNLMTQLTARYLTDPKSEIKTITDSLGNQSLVAVNPYDLTTKDVTPGATASSDTPNENSGMSITAAAGLRNAAKLPQNYDPTTHRDEAFLNALDPLTKSAVQDIADGKMPSTGRNMQKMMPLVSRYENGFDNTRYQARQALEKSYYGGGEGAKALRSANTTIDHGIQLSKAIDDLHNYSMLPGFLNPITGKVSEQFNKKYQVALSRFQVNSELYSKELDFALTGKSTDSGTNHRREMFDMYGSPVKNKAAMQQTLEMLQQRINEHENTYRTGMNKNGQVFNDMLTRRKDLQKLLGEDTGGGNSSEPAAAAPAAMPAGKTTNGFSWSVQP